MLSHTALSPLFREMCKMDSAGNKHSWRASTTVISSVNRGNATVTIYIHIAVYYSAIIYFNDYIL
jgi:hypothetical protein